VAVATKSLEENMSRNGQNGSSNGNGHAIQNLKQLFNVEKAGRPSYHGGWVPLLHVNVLPQPRQTFENLPELAQDIATNGILNPFIVARFTRAGCEEYLAVINYLWGTAFSRQQLKRVSEQGEEVYYVLLAGERRFRSFKHLWETGCADCLETWGGRRRKQGTCYLKHFHTDKVEIRVADRVSALAALFLQMSENTHMAVPAHQEAKAYAQLYKAIRMFDDKVNITRFARKVGRHPSTITKAIRFCDLPGSIQELVEEGIFSYGIALELSRLKQSGITDEQLRWWEINIVAQNYNLKDFRLMVDEELRCKAGGQDSFVPMSLFSGDEGRKQHRQVVAENMVKSMWNTYHYFRKVLALFERGHLGKKDSPFSSGSPLRIFFRQIEVMQEVLPHLQGLVSASRLEEATEVLEVTKATVVDLYVQHKGDSSLLEATPAIGGGE
jgi:hypothetical protein